MGILSRISNGIQAAQDWWADDTVMFSRNPKKVLNEHAVQRNIQNEQIKEDIVRETLTGDVDSILQKEAEREQMHQEQIKNIMNESAYIAENITLENAERTVILKRNQLAREARNREIERQAELNHIIASESFNFYKVKDLLLSGVSLQDALTSAGCQENFAYQLDHDGRVFIRLRDDAVDNVCLNCIQNMKMEKYLETKNAAVMAVGFPEQTSFSIACLVYDKHFGFILIKNDKYIETYANDIVEDLYSWGVLNDKLGFDRIALGKTFMKVAVPCAICVNVERGIESEEDWKQYDEMLQYSEIACKRFNNAVNYFGLVLK